MHPREDEQEREREIAPGLKGYHHAQRQRERDRQTKNLDLDRAHAEEVNRGFHRPHLHQQRVQRAREWVEHDHPGEGSRDHRRNEGEQQEATEHGTAPEGLVEQQRSEQT